MPIPQLDEATGYLPPGEHTATWEEVVERFGWNRRRKMLCLSLREVATELWHRGAERLWVDGSFVTDKERPGDVDVVYDAPTSVDVDTWGPLAPSRRAELKAATRVDLWKFPAGRLDPFRPGHIDTILDIFAHDEDGVSKGIIRLTEGRPHVAERSTAEQHP